MIDSNPKPEYSEEEGMFVYGDGSVPYCFYIASSAAITEDNVIIENNEE